MKKLVVLLALMLSSFAHAELQLECRDKGSETVVYLKVTKEEINSVLILNNDFAPVDADVCTLGVDPIFAPYVAEQSSVIGACVFISSNDGSGELVVIRDYKEEQGAYFAEVKRAEIDAPSQDFGKTLLECEER